MVVVVRFVVVYVVISKGWGYFLVEVDERDYMYVCGVVDIVIGFVSIFS